jgi:hypothetical protein
MLTIELPRGTPSITLQPGLNLPRQRTEIGNALQFVIRKFYVKMILQLGQQVERLQAINLETLEKIVIRMQFIPRHLEVRRSKAKYFFQRLVSGLHK